MTRSWQSETRINYSNSKREEALSFINSNKFGIDTWTTIFNFSLNSHNIILTIELNSTLIERLEKGELLTNNNRQDIIRIQQQIVLDAILKIQILIESTLVLIHSLSTGYHTVAKNMTYYDINLFDAIIDEIRKNKKIKNYKYNLKKSLVYQILNICLYHQRKKILEC